jgi:hypothetical protein
LIGVVRECARYYARVSRISCAVLDSAGAAGCDIDSALK